MRRPGPDHERDPRETFELVAAVAGQVRMRGRLHPGLPGRPEMGTAQVHEGEERPGVCEAPFVADLLERRDRSRCSLLCLGGPPLGARPHSDRQPEDVRMSLKTGIARAGCRVGHLGENGL